MRSCCCRITSILLLVLLSLIGNHSHCFGEIRYAFTATDRDPFSPLVSKSGVILIPREIDLKGLSIKGIIYSEESPVAVINDEVVAKGQSIGEYLVVEIEEKMVILKKGNQEFILKLEEEGE